MSHAFLHDSQTEGGPDDDDVGGVDIPGETAAEAVGHVSGLHVHTLHPHVHH
jgi:hypothetical protein